MYVGESIELEKAGWQEKRKHEMPEENKSRQEKTGGGHNNASGITLGFKKRLTGKPGGPTKELKGNPGSPRHSKKGLGGNPGSVMASKKEWTSKYGFLGFHGQAK